MWLKICIILRLSIVIFSHVVYNSIRTSITISNENTSNNPKFNTEDNSNNVMV